MKAVWAKILQHKKWLVLIAVLLIAGKAGMMIYQNSTAKTTATVQTITVERGDITAVVAATGTIKPVNMVDISSKITGLIKDLRVKENDQVKAGQLLVVLDASRLEAQVAQARERLVNAEASYERNRRLQTIGAVSDQQLDDARMNFKVAQANFEDASLQLNETTITSPIDGVVIGKPIPAGQTVAQGISNPMVILTVADMSKMQIETQVDESDIGKIAVGQQATFAVDAYQGKKFTGVVSNISQKATVQQNVVYYSVIIDVASAENLLKPTMTARVSINVGERTNTLTVPLAAVKTNKDGQYVVVMKDTGRTENVPITTGLAADDRVEILSGLVEGDKLVMSQAKPQEAKQQGAGQSMRLPH